MPEAVVPSVLMGAANRLADLFGSEGLGDDVGTHMTCDEAEGVANVMRAVGRHEEAAAFLRGHGTEDDEGDSHFQGEEQGK